MARPLSELLQNLIADAEMVSSFYEAVDKQRRFDGMTEEEAVLLRKTLRRIFGEYGRSADSFTSRKNMVKTHIKEAKKNESLYAR